MRLKKKIYASMFFLAFATPASSGPASDAFDTCENITLDATAFTENMHKKKFISLAVHNAEAFKSVFIDGTIIASATPRQLFFDWEGSLQEADELANILIERRNQSENLRVFYNPIIKATLVRLDQSTQGEGRIHCLFSGPSDDEMRYMIDTVARMDTRAGLKMSPPEFQLMLLNTIEGTKTVDAQIARYTDAAAAKLGRAPNVDMSFSLIVLFTRK